MTVEGIEARQDNTVKYRIIKDIIRQNREIATIVMGDMNAHIGVLGERVNGNGELLLQLAEDEAIEILNNTIAEGRVTWSARGLESAIDYIMVNSVAREDVVDVWVDEERRIDIASDHNAVIMNCRRDKGQNRERRRRPQGMKWKVKGADWNNFQQELSTLDNILYEDVDHMNKQLVDNLSAVAWRTVGQRRVRRRRTHNNSWWPREIAEARVKRKRANRVNRQKRKLHRRGGITEEECNEAWKVYQEKRNKVKTLFSEQRLRMRKEQLKP